MGGLPYHHQSKGLQTPPETNAAKPFQWFGCFFFKWRISLGWADSVLVWSRNGHSLYWMIDSPRLFGIKDVLYARFAVCEVTLKKIERM